ncbi:PREDICTED: serine carboxypeptidase-like 18 [Tarenaya hassleriana]|uniref:serine carboxypeptidase-like 18 n=1 Tax=Tarenaya hassleriana TaxID=28532 RepID=UPI00053C8A1B|nr:PREDICTED: serine carboxypeptidase-like 18 [Tarenaya hassleriana]
MKVVPPAVLFISEGNDQGVEPRVNLKGYVLGNPLTDEEADNDAGIPYAHRMGIISDEIYESLVTSCKGKYFLVEPSNIECARALERFDECTKDINGALITADKCHPDLPYPGPECQTYFYTLSYYWSNDESVRTTLGIRKGTIGKWDRCNREEIPYEEDIDSALPYHVNLSNRGYRSLVYSGDHDIIVSYVATQAWIKALGYPVVDEWRPWMDNRQIQG